MQSSVCATLELTGGEGAGLTRGVGWGWSQGGKIKEKKAGEQKGLNEIEHSPSGCAERQAQWY